MIMRNNNVKYLTLTAVYAAVIYIFTAYLHIPHWTGYVHVGDGVLYLASSMLPPVCSGGGCDRRRGGGYLVGICALGAWNDSD